MPIPHADKPPICGPPLTSHDDVGAAHGDFPAELSRPSTWHHWVFLVMASGVVAASLACSIRGREQVILPILNTAVPGSCTFRRLTDLPCPGCGMTRAFISLAHGRLADAWSFNPAALVFFAVVVFQIPYRIFQISRIRRGLAEHRFVAFDHWVLVGVVVILLVQWVWAMAIRMW